MTVKTKLNKDMLKGLQRKKTNRVVLLYSSGIDSTASAIMLKGQGYDVFPLFIYYGQRSATVEGVLVDKGASKIGIRPVRKIDISDITQLCSSKLINGISVDDNDAWLPARNTLFLVMAGMYAQSIDADAISIGYGLDDNFVFGDNMITHHQLTEVLLSFSMAREVRVLLPVKHLRKKALIQIVRDYGLLDLTVSCWNARWQNGKIVVCNQCANCIERKQAL